MKVTRLNKLFRLDRHAGTYWGLLLFSVALGFNLYQLGVPSIWFDEAFSVELARQPFPVSWHIIFGLEPNMELYYLFLYGWLQVTSALGWLPTEFVVRLPSAIFAALSTVIVFALGRRFICMTAGIVGASLYLLDYLQLVYAQQTRAYSLQLLLICISWYALLTAFSSPSSFRRWWVCYTFSLVLSLYTHLFSLLLLLAQCVAIGGFLLLPNGLQKRARERSKVFGLCLLTIGILSIPLAYVARTGAKTGWLPAPDFADLVYLANMISGHSKLYLLAIAVCATTGVVAGTLIYLLSSVCHSGQQIKERLSHLVTKVTSMVFVMKSGEEEVCGQLKGDTSIGSAENKGEWTPDLIVWILLCWLMIPVGVSYIVSQGSIRLFSERYLVTIVPPLLLLVSLGIMVLRWRLIRIALAVGLIGLAFSRVPLYYQSAQVEDWKATTHWLQQRYQEGDGLVCYDNSVQQGCQVAVEYYLHAYPGKAHFSEDTPGAFAWEKLGPATAAGPDAAVDPAVLTDYGKKHSRLFFVVGRVRDDAAADREQAAREWLDDHYQRVDMIETRTVKVYLYNTQNTKP